MNILLKFTLVSIATLGAVLGQTSSKQGLVGNIRNRAVVDGCGCYFRFRGTPDSADRDMFFSSIEKDQKTAWMNIGGRDLKLTLKKEEGLRGKEQEKVGSRSKVTYQAGPITVTGTWIVTRVCDPKDENCESTQYDATFVVRKGTRSQVVKAVGSCGC